MPLLPSALVALRGLELFVAVTVALTAVRAGRRSPERLAELAVACVFGFALEAAAMATFDTYQYSALWLTVGPVPVAIALTWGLLIVGAMNLSDALGLADVTVVRREPGALGLVRWLVRGLPAPLADALWVLLLDLSLDAVAIRLDLWTWTIRRDQGWFGVPWGNLLAWLVVGFWFSFLTRLVRARTQRQGRCSRWQWLVPVPATLAMLAVLVPFVWREGPAALPFGWGGAARLEPYHDEIGAHFWLLVGVLVAVTVRSLALAGPAREAVDGWLRLVRLGVHLEFLGALLLLGLHRDEPALLAVSLGLLAVELGVFHGLFALRDGRPAAWASRLRRGLRAAARRAAPARHRPGVPRGQRLSRRRAPALRRDAGLTRGASSAPTPWG